MVESPRFRMSTPLSRRGFFAALAALPVAAVAVLKATPKPRIAIRFVKQYDITTDCLPRRVDCWVGTPYGLSEPR